MVVIFLTKILIIKKTELFFSFLTKHPMLWQILPHFDTTVCWAFMNFWNVNKILGHLVYLIHLNTMLWIQQSFNAATNDKHEIMVFKNKKAAPPHENSNCLVALRYHKKATMKFFIKKQQFFGNFLILVNRLCMYMRRVHHDDIKSFNLKLTYLIFPSLNFLSPSSSSLRKATAQNAKMQNQGENSEKLY